MHSPDSYTHTSILTSRSDSAGPVNRLLRMLHALALTLLIGTASVFAGAIVIDGTDANDHGSFNGVVNQDGWLYMQRVLESLAAQAPPGANKVVVDLGTDPGTDARNAIVSAFTNSSLPGNGWALLHVNGSASVTAWLASLTINNTGILYLPTADLTNGDMDAAELAAINAGAFQIADFVNTQGGALFAMGESGPGAFGWLSTLIPGLNFTDVGGGGITSDITLTPDGAAAFPGLTNGDLAGADPWHGYFSGNLGSLKVLGTAVDETNTTRALILGGAAATLGSLGAPSDQKPGSVLMFPIYSSSVNNPVAEDTRINITNTSQTDSVGVHLYFIDGDSCSVADSFVCLTPNQTTALQVSDADPGIMGFLIAVAVNFDGCPISFNHLIGDEYIKLASGHAANLAAEAFAAGFSGALPGCTTLSTEATLEFNGISYDLVPRVLALDSIPSLADGNSTLLVVNRIGGNMQIAGAEIGRFFGLIYDPLENPVSFTSSGGCQIRRILGQNSFPRTTPRLTQFIPSGLTGWMKFWATSDVGLFGSAIYLTRASETQGHNLHKLTLTRGRLTVPVFPPRCG